MYSPTKVDLAEQVLDSVIFAGFIGTDMSPHIALLDYGLLWHPERGIAIWCRNYEDKVVFYAVDNISREEVREYAREEVLGNESYHDCYDTSDTMVRAMMQEDHGLVHLLQNNEGHLGNWHKASLNLRDMIVIVATRVGHPTPGTLADSLLAEAEAFYG